MKLFRTLILFISIFVSAIFLNCSSSTNTEDRTESWERETERKSQTETSENSVILKTAKTEQENEMYSPLSDSTYLYWLDSALIILSGPTKCNIFALNVLSRSGYITPEVNALSGDLFDTSEFIDILPVVGINEISNARKGDLIVWISHVIIFESLIEINHEKYAKGYWAGTRMEDNGDNIKNNVCYGNYKLDGEFVVRRPVKK